MKALVPGVAGASLRFEASHPDPAPGLAECVIRVTRAGICGTDLQLARGYRGGFRDVPGHEFVGVVDSAPGRHDLVGTRVVAEVNVVCGVCLTCRAGRRSHCPNRSALGLFGRPGAFAERIAVPIANLHAVPDSVSDDEAVFVEPLAAAARVTEQVRIGPGVRCVVVGDGRLGLLVAQVLHADGAQVTALGRYAAKLAVLAARGIATAADPSQVPRGADVVVEATGSPEGLGAALDLVRPEGTVVLKTTCADSPGQSPVPQRADWNHVVVEEISIVGSRCGPFAKALALLARRAVDTAPLISARFPLERGAEAFACAGARGTMKVLLDVG